VRNICYDSAPATISLRVQPGEIVGLAGIVGAGRTELARVLFGIDRVRGGELFVDGRVVRLRNPRQAIRAGLALVPEDRKLQGLILQMNVRQNISLAWLPRASRWGWLNRRGESQLAADDMRVLSIRARSAEQPVLELSGGNQQKVVLAKWLSLEPRVLILDEPTRGVDGGAKQEIYRLMRSAAERGMGILMISSEMEEVIGLSDRVLVMREGRIAGELTGDQSCEPQVLKLAVGASPAESAA
jgi:ribose transport system ATP-binding protein